MGSSILSDAVHAVRMMARRPVFTAVVVLTLAVGIGATTAMFGIVSSALLSRLPFEEPDRLVLGRATFDGNINPWVSGYDYFDYRDQSHSFESLAAFMFVGRVTVLGDAGPERVAGAFATWDLFPTLRVSPVMGRSFTAEEAVPGGPSVIMISYAYWQRRFGGSPDAVGTSLRIRGAPHVIVGVLPQGFRFLQEVDIWALTYRDGPGAAARRWHNLLVAGRLKPGTSVPQAQAEVDAISRRLEQQYPDTNEGKALAVTPLHDAMVEDVRTSLLTLMAAVSLLLLLACGNVAGLLLARGQTRLREIAVRTAMGASRLRLIRQLLTESSLMALVAGLAGLAFALSFQGLLIRLLPMGQLGVTQPEIDTRMLLFALGVSIATGTLFGIVPALQGTIVEPSQQLKAGARATSARSALVLRGGVVVVQVAISTMLLVGAGLAIRSLSSQMSVDLGFDPTNVFTASVRLPDDVYPEAERRIAFFTSLVEEVRALPGVASVGVVSRIPILNPSGNIYVYPADQPIEESQGAKMSRSADYRSVLPGYLRTMGIPILAGRDIEETDVEGSPRVTLITESMAELFFPEQDPLGQRLSVDMGERVVHEVVGVVGNARLSSVTAQPFHAMYMSYKQNPQHGMGLAVRATGEPSVLAGPVRGILREKDPNIPLAEPTTMAAILDEALAGSRVVTSSLGWFSSIALMLALVGLYGVLAFHVSQRRHEIGVRMALGASRQRVAKRVLARGMGMVAVGLGLGLAGSYWASRLIQQMLFGVEPSDPATYAAAAMGFGLVALAACLLPAWRATQVDPASILQAE